ncbi:hypothetical protein JCM3774_004069 [Rhodotorula dairenensis]
MDEAQQAAVENRLLEMVGALPADVNPWRFLENYVQESVSPTMPDVAYRQLYALFALLGLCGILCLASLIWRAKKGIFWIFRIQRDPIPILCPHIVISWSLSFLLMVICPSVSLWPRKTRNPTLLTLLDPVQFSWSTSAYVIAISAAI